MGSSFLKLAALAAAFTVCAVPAAQEGANAVAGSSGGSSPIDWSADSFSIDGNSELITFEGLRLTHGGLEVQADRAVATGVDFGSEWRFEGNVRITQDSALLEADSAIFKFGERELAVAELHGSPATFSDTSPERKQPARGGAASLSYDYATQTLRLTGDAWLRLGPHEVRGCDMVYSFADGRGGAGSAACSERFNISIDPSAEDSAEDAASDSAQAP